MHSAAATLVARFVQLLPRRDKCFRPHFRSMGSLREMHSHVDDVGVVNHAEEGDFVPDVFHLDEEHMRTAKTSSCPQVSRWGLIASGAGCAKANNRATFRASSQTS